MEGYRFILLSLLVGCDCSSTSVAPDASVALDVPGDTRVVLGRRELCNGVDDDLDGKRDEGCPIRLTSSEHDDVSPSLDGTRVAWSRQMRGGPSEIWVQDLPDGEARFVAEGVVPSLSGDRIAYLRDGLFVIDLMTGVEQEIETPEARNLQSPHLEGSLLVWSFYPEGTEDRTDMLAFDLDTGERTILAEHGALQQFPVVERGGRRIAYRDDRHGHHTVGLLHLFDIFLIDAPGVETQRMTMRAAEQVFGYVRSFESGQVLTDEVIGPLTPGGQDHPCRPVLVDLDRDTMRTLGEPIRPCYTSRDRSEQRAVLEYDPSGISDLYLWLLDTDEVVQVTDHSRLSTSPVLRGDLLVWTDDRNDQYELYMMDLSDMESGDFFPEGLRP